MTEAVKKGIQEFKRCRRRWTKWRDPKSEHDLRIAETTTKDLIDEEVRKHWNTYLDDTSNRPSNTFWKKVTNIINDRNNHRATITKLGNQRTHMEG